MCNCPNVHFFEVDFKLAGMQVVPSHKNCGDALNEDQNSKFEKELLKYWGFENKARQFGKVNFTFLLVNSTGALFVNFINSRINSAIGDLNDQNVNGEY